MAQMTHPVAVTDGDFPQFVEEASKTRPVLVDFWADWCPPCRMLAPILDQIADELRDTLTIVKMNTDEHPQVASSLGVMANPTLILYKGGVPVATIVGFQPRRMLLAKLQPHLRE